MNSRERILAAINRQPINRIPTDIWATPEVFAKLRDHFGNDTDIMAELHSDGTGYILAPCHNLQANTPVENIIAMYDEAWQY